MSSYYYLISTLPTLDPEKGLALTEAEFLVLCEKHLTRNDFRVISSVTGAETDLPNSTLRAWLEFEQSLNHALAEERAQRLEHVKNEMYVNTFEKNPQIAEAVRKAVTEESPLLGEKILDAAKFAFLDDLEVNHFFDLTKLIVYYLKLRILEREQYFDFVRGDEEFKRLLSNIQTSIKSY